VTILLLYPVSCLLWLGRILKCVAPISSLTPRSLPPSLRQLLSLYFGIKLLLEARGMKNKTPIPHLTPPSFPPSLPPSLPQLLFLYFGIKLLVEARGMEGSGPSDELQEVEDELIHKKEGMPRPPSLPPSLPPSFPYPPDA